MYEDDGINFAQKQFDASRERNKKIAEDQEKFSKGLLAVDAVVKGASLLINNRAKELDAAQAPKKAAYQASLNRAANFRNSDAERIKKGKTVNEYLTDLYYNKLKTTAEEDYANLSPIAYSKALRKEAKNLAIDNADEYKNLLKESNNFVGYDDFDDYYKSSSNIPRSIAGWVSGRTKKFFGKETEETLKIKNEKASDALYGTDAFKRFGNLSEAILAYDTVTGEGKELTDIMTKLDIKVGKVVKEASKLETKVLIDKVNGTSTNVTTYSQGTLTPNGTVEFLPENINVISESVTATDDNLVKVTDVAKLFALVKPEYHKELNEIMQSQGGSARPTFKAFELVRKKLNDNAQMYKIDFSSEKNKEDAFVKWYSIQIQGAKNPQGEFISGSKSSDGVYKILEAQRGAAQKMGLDVISMRREYDKLGSKALPRDADDIALDDTIDLRTLIADKNQSQYGNLFTGKNPKILEIFGPIIDSNTYSNRDIVPLGVNDIGQIFPQLGLTGSYDLYFDRRTATLKVKE